MGVDGALNCFHIHRRIGERCGLNLGTQLNYNYGDVCRGEVMVDPQGDVWLATSTRSDDFPMANAFDPGLNGPSDAVIVRLIGGPRPTLSFRVLFRRESGRCGLCRSVRARKHHHGLRCTGGTSAVVICQPRRTRTSRTWQGRATAICISL